MLKPGGQAAREAAGVFATIAGHLALGLEPGEAMARAGVGAGRLAELLTQVAELLSPQPDAPAEEPSRPAGVTADHLILHADGGARGNPGPAGAGAVLSTADGAKVAGLSRYLGETTNNVAEYQGLIMGLEKARELGAAKLDVFLDSELVVKQLSGAYKVKSPHLKPLYEKARGLIKGFASCRVSHVPRAKNAEADRLANQAMDRRR